MNVNNLPDNNAKINIKLFILDPLSVIIKLAILSKKPIGTKIFIQNNILHLQEPGPFQSLCRIIFNTNKTDLQYMYNPIHVACQHFLSKDFIQKTPRMKNLFLCAQDGIKNLMETYNSCSIIVLTLNYYYIIINNHVEQIYNDSIFRRDSMTALYTKDMVDELITKWKEEKIKIVLDIIVFLKTDSMAASNVKSLENILENIDKESREILKKH